jgi:hypothetical protein
MNRNRARWTTATVLGYLVLYGTVGLALICKPFNTGDYCVHLSVIRSLAEGRALQDNPLSEGAIERLHDPEHVFWAFVMRHTSLSGTNLMALAGLVNVGVFFAGVAMLGRSLGPRRTMPLMLLLTLLFLWGVGYNWSNEYSFSMLPVGGAYPSTLAWGVSFMVLALCHTWSRHGGAARLVVAALLMAFVAAQHALTACMFTLWFPVMWVWLGRTTWRRRLTLAAFPFAALVISLLWAWNSVLTQLQLVRVATENSGVTARAFHFLRPSVSLLALGPALAGLAFLPLAPRSWRRRLAAGAAIYATAWLCGSLLRITLAHRFVFFLVFALQLPVAGALARGVGLLSRRAEARRRLAGVWTAAFAVLLLPWAPLQLWGATSHIRARISLRPLEIRPSRYAPYESVAEALAKRLNPNDRVLTDRTTAKLLAGLGVPIVQDGGLSGEDIWMPPRLDRSFSSLDPDYFDLVRWRHSVTGATHLLISHNDVLGRDKLAPWEKQALKSLGWISSSSPGFTLVKFRKEKGGGGQSAGPSSNREVNPPGQERPSD